MIGSLLKYLTIMSNLSSVNTQRLIPSALSLSHSHLNWGIEVFSSEEKLSAIAFSGKSKKADWHYRFRSLEQMAAHIEKWLGNVISKFEAQAAEKKQRAEQNAALSAADHYQVGDILYNSWGWEQTNIDFYLVTAVKNKTIEVQSVYPLQVEGSMYSHGMACMVVASEEINPNGESFQLKVKAGYRGSVMLSAPKSYYHFSKWDGRPLYRSWYA